MMEETSLRDIRFVRGRRGEGDELEIEKAIFAKCEFVKESSNTYLLLYVVYFRIRWSVLITQL